MASRCLKQWMMLFITYKHSSKQYTAFYGDGLTLLSIHKQEGAVFISLSETTGIWQNNQNGLGKFLITSVFHQYRNIHQNSTEHINMMTPKPAPDTTRSVLPKINRHCNICPGRMSGWILAMIMVGHSVLSSVCWLVGWLNSCMNEEYSFSQDSHYGQ